MWTFSTVLNADFFLMLTLFILNTFLLTFSYNFAWHFTMCMSIKDWLFPSFVISSKLCFILQPHVLEIHFGVTVKFFVSFLIGWVFIAYYNACEMGAGEKYGLYQVIIIDFLKSICNNSSLFPTPHIRLWYLHSASCCYGRKEFSYCQIGWSLSNTYGSPETG